MADKTIFTVGFELPTNKFEYVDIESNRTFADADIILLEAKLTSGNYDKCQSYTRHWHNEIISAYNAGKTIFIYLPTRSTVSSYGGSDIDSFTNILPLRKTESENKQGKKVKFTEKGKLLTGYWSLITGKSSYEVTFDFGAIPLLKTNDNTDTVGAYLNVQDKGTMFFLPPIKLPKSFRPIAKWSEEAAQFGHNLFNEIIVIDKIVKITGELSSEPDWLKVPEFVLAKEDEYNNVVSAKEEAIKKLQEEIMTIEDELAEVTIPKQLLYETGIPLEKAIINGLRIIGFEADNFQDEESEFDIVFNSEEGRFIGESEGKNTKAIAVDKARQLEINIQEDFHKDEVEEYAIGVLFGNGYRLTEPNQREEEFTTKVQTLAKRSGISLVATSKLFEVVKYIHDTNDQDYAKTVRECFRDTKGKIMVFPPIPIS